MTSRDLERFLNPAPGTQVTQATAVEQSRAVAEVLAATTAARQFPRDLDAVRAAMLQTCGTRQVAERAFYSVPNRGTGPSVHLARELANCWGHLQSSVDEIRRDDDAGMSEIRAWAIDWQTGRRDGRTFQHPHARMAGKSRQALTDLTDIYLSNQNVGARALRECIFAVLPGWFVEEAIAACRATLERGDGTALEERVAGAVKGFADGFGVTAVQLERRVGVPRERWTEQHVADLGVLFRSIRSGDTTVEQEFGEPERVGDAIREQAARSRKPRGEQPAAAAPADPPVVEDPPEHDPTLEPGWPGEPLDGAQ